MYRPSVLMARTLVPISYVTLAECWDGLVKVFYLPDFEILEHDLRIINWLREERIKRERTTQRTPRFLRVIEDGDPKLEVVTGVSRRVIQITEREDGRYLLQIDFAKPSLFCAAKVLDRLPLGLSMEIEVLRFNESMTLEWTTGDPAPADLLVDRDAIAPGELPEGVVIPVLMSA